jgi:hypothetical protein
MSLIPATTGLPQMGRHKWKTIRYAVDDTGRTVRLVAILLTMSIACTLPFLILALALGQTGVTTARSPAVVTNVFSQHGATPLRRDRGEKPDSSLARP